MVDITDPTPIPAARSTAIPENRKAAENAPPSHRLSMRLLLLTIAFGMIAEVVIFVPTMARYRFEYLNEKLATAHLVFTALDVAANKTGQIDPFLRDNLLSQGRVLGMSVQRPGLPKRTFGPAIPARIPIAYDLRTSTFWDLVSNAFYTMWRRDTYAIDVIGVSPANPAVIVEVVFDERPLRVNMWAYAQRIFFFSLFISISTAALVYVSIQWLAVRPLRRLTISMTGFQKAPEDPRSIITPSTRNDEVGVAERTLAVMQQELRAALLQKERLAGVGTAVTKISHDLKNILATAMLESERLEALPDPEVRRLAAGMVRAIERAAQLSTSTLRFAKEGLPHVRKQDVQLSHFLAELKTELQPTLKNATLHIVGGENVSIAGDPELLYRAFENLVQNADQAGATSVELKAVKVKAGADGERHTIHVIDNGPGLPKRAQDNLFVPFAGSARAEGFGLGLPIARELIRAQGGDITLLWTSAEGSCFVVRLPL